jgi:hypothetical protein
VARDCLARISATFPDLTVELDVVASGQAPALLRASRTASLVVLGARRGGPGPGPTTLALLLRAATAVLTVPVPHGGVAPLPSPRAATQEPRQPAAAGRG